MWSFTSTSVINYNYASLSQLFVVAPIIFLFLIPAVTMQSFADEYQQGTMEFLTTKPLTDLQIVLGKYFASLSLVCLALLPTLIYYASIYKLGSPVGNIDNGEVIGSYIGLFCLSAVFVSIGVFMSSLTSNQIVAFILSAFGCFIIYWAFDFMSDLPVFFGSWDNFLKSLGVEYHYDNISKGRIDSRDIIYFISVTIFFIWMTYVSLDKRRW